MRIPQRDGRRAGTGRRGGGIDSPLPLLVLLPGLLTAGSCAGGRIPPASAPSAVAGPVVAETPPNAAAASLGETERESRLARVYRELETWRDEYEAGIELIVGGEEVAGEERLAVAANRLRAAAAECTVIDGCEIDRVIETLQDLLDRQGLALKTQSYDLQILRTSAGEDVEREPGTSSFAAPETELDRAASLLRGTHLAEIIPLNGPVTAALDDWLTWLRPLLMQSWENYRFLRPAMAPVYEEAGLPEALLFGVVATETGGKIHSFSRAGAAGPLQFMEHTGRIYGLKVVDGFDQRLDPEAATRASVAYLNDRFKQFNDSLEKALAAYNGGENRMRNLHRRTDGASLWDTRVFYSLPSETREYVPRVLAAAWLFLHPEDYGLEFPRVDAATTDLVIREPIAISELSICLGQEGKRDGWFRTLRNLNPRLGPGERVEAGEVVRVPAAIPPIYEKRCRTGKILEQARVLHDANYPDEPEMIPYVVRRGDTLGRIASRHRCVSLRELAEINRIRPPRYVIHVGQTIRIPSCGYR